MQTNTSLKTISLDHFGIDELYIHRFFRIKGPKWNKFTGNIYYKRKLSTSYKDGGSDLLDEFIYDAIKKNYPEATLCFEQVIIFKQQLDSIIFTHKGGCCLDYKIYFIPNAECFDLSQTNHTNSQASVLNMNFYLNLSPDSEKLNDIVLDAFLPLNENDLLFIKEKLVEYVK